MRLDVAKPLPQTRCLNFSFFTPWGTNAPPGGTPSVLAAGSYIA